MITRSLLCSSALLLLAPWGAEAALTYDLRLGDGSKEVDQVSAGELIPLELWVMVTGADADTTNDGFQNGYGSIVSSNGGGIQGDLSATLLAPFTANGSQNGTPTDLDGDGDLDLGSASSTSNPSFLFARSAGLETTSGNALANGREFKLATVLFAVNSVAPNGTITLNFSVPTFTGRTDIAALWQEDGFARNTNPGGGGSMPGVGADVILTTIPEPSSYLLLGMGALAGWGLRRRRS